MPQYINPYTDFGLKWLFGTEKNKAILIDFLNALFDGMEVVEDLEYRQNEHLGAGPKVMWQPMPSAYGSPAAANIRVFEKLATGNALV